MIELRGLFEYFAPLREVLVEITQRWVLREASHDRSHLPVDLFPCPIARSSGRHLFRFCLSLCSKEVPVVLFFLCPSRPAFLVACHVVTAFTLAFDYVVRVLCLAMAQVAARPARPVLRSVGWFASVLATCVALTC